MNSHQYDHTKYDHTVHLYASKDSYDLHVSIDENTNPNDEKSSTTIHRSPPLLNKKSFTQTSKDTSMSPDNNVKRNTTESRQDSSQGKKYLSIVEKPQQFGNTPNSSKFTTSDSSQLNSVSHVKVVIESEITQENQYPIPHYTSIGTIHSRRSDDTERKTAMDNMTVASQQIQQKTFSGDVTTIHITSTFSSGVKEEPVDNEEPVANEESSSKSSGQDSTLNGKRNSKKNSGHSGSRNKNSFSLFHRPLTLNYIL